MSTTSGSLQALALTIINQQSCTNEPATLYWRWNEEIAEMHHVQLCITSSENWATLVFGDNMTSTFAIPPLACSVMGCSLGSKRITPGSCNAGVNGFKVILKVNGAALLFTTGMIFFNVWPIRSAPNFTIFCRASATLTCWQHVRLLFCDQNHIRCLSAKTP